MMNTTPDVTLLPEGAKVTLTLTLTLTLTPTPTLSLTPTLKAKSAPRRTSPEPSEQAVLGEEEADRGWNLVRHLG